MDHLFGEEDEDGESKKRRAKELGGEGDMDEQPYEEDFADDDEHMAPDENDEEAKEAEVCINYAEESLMLTTIDRNGLNESTGPRISSASPVLMTRRKRKRTLE